jgi:hypothetical protein
VQAGSPNLQPAWFTGLSELEKLRKAQPIKEARKARNLSFHWLPSEITVFATAKWSETFSFSSSRARSQHYHLVTSHQPPPEVPARSSSARRRQHPPAPAGVPEVAARSPVMLRRAHAWLMPPAAAMSRTRQVRAGDLRRMSPSGSNAAPASPCIGEPPPRSPGHPLQICRGETTDLLQEISD